MDYKKVDLAVALKAVTYQRQLIARRTKRRVKVADTNMKQLQEQSMLENSVFFIGHNVNQIRKFFKLIEKIEKRLDRKEAVIDKMAGRNQGNFRNR